MEDRPTDRPTDLGIKAPSRSLKNLNDENLKVVEQTKLLDIILSDTSSGIIILNAWWKKAYSRMELLRKVA